MNSDWKKLIEKYRNDALLKPHLNKILINLFILLISLILFIGLALMLESSFIKNSDQQIIDYVFLNRTPYFTQIMKFTSRLGDSLGYVTVFTLMSFVLFLYKKWTLVMNAFFILLFSSGLNILLKNAIARPRPFEFALVQANYYSFPSGHAMSAIVFYGFLIYITNQLVKQFWLKYLLFSISVFLTLAMGLSRIYLGVHYPSDIIGGFLSGLFLLMFSLFIINLLKIRKIYFTY